MRFMTLVRGHEGQGEPPQELFDAIAKFGAEAMSEGTLLSTGGLTPSAQGSRIRIKSGTLNVTDGPFTEAKEVIGGYALFEVSSKKEMMEIATRFMELHREYWPEWEGECEIREEFPPPEFG